MFAQEANMHENRFNEYRIPSGMLVVFLEKALTLIHMETHLDDVSPQLRPECPGPNPPSGQLPGWARTTQPF